MYMETTEFVGVNVYYSWVYEDQNRLSLGKSSFNQSFLITRHLDQIAQKIEKISSTNIDHTPEFGRGGNRLDYEVEAGVQIKWGGEKDSEVSAYAKGDLEDRNGNFAHAEIKRDQDGRKEVEISGGHKSNN